MSPDAIGRLALDANKHGVTRRLEFEGRFSEYLHRWTFHYVLCILTVGLYIPWAEAHFRRFAAASTLIDGQQLTFEGQPLRVLVFYVASVLFAGSSLLLFGSESQTLLPLLGLY